MLVNNNSSVQKITAVEETSKKTTISKTDAKVSRIAKSFFASIGAFIAAPFKFCAKVIKSGFVTLISLFKKAYPSLPLKRRALNDQATIALKDALVRSSPQVFANLGSKQTPKQIREWFENPINLPLLQGVQELNLSGRGLSLVPSELRFLSNLQRLDLSENQLTSIDPQTFANLQNLQRLDLYQNKLTSIDPQTFANLQNLQWLDLYQNKLTSIDPQTFANLQNLELLYLSQNQLTSIAPQTFANLQNLQRLDLSGNPITSAGPIDRGSLGLIEGVALVL